MTARGGRVFGGVCGNSARAVDDFSVKNTSAAVKFMLAESVDAFALRMLLLCLADWQVDLHAVLSDEQMPVEKTIDGFVPVPLGVVGVV